MQVTARQINAVQVLAVEGELSRPFAPAFLRTARRLLTTTPRPLVAVDLARVPHVDASGFGALVTLLRDVAQRRGSLCLAGLRPEVRLLLEIMQLHLLFEVCADVDGAVQALVQSELAATLPDAARARGAARPLEQAAS